MKMSIKINASAMGFILLSWLIITGAAGTGNTCCDLEFKSGYPSHFSSQQTGLFISTDRHAFSCRTPLSAAVEIENVCCKQNECLPENLPSFKIKSAKLKTGLYYFKDAGQGLTENRSVRTVIKPAGSNLSNPIYIMVQSFLC